MRKRKITFKNCIDYNLHILKPKPNNDSQSDPLVNHSSSVINNFISGKSLNEETKDQNLKIFHLFNQIISFICKYESQLKANLDIPIKMSTLIKKRGREILNPDLKLKDVIKIIKWAEMMTSDNVVDQSILKNSQENFMQYVKLLDKQTKLRKELKTIPSIAFGVEELKPFSIDEFKECMDKIKKLKSKYTEIISQVE